MPTARCDQNPVRCPSPDTKSSRDPILEILSDEQDRNVRDVYSQAADRLRLTDADREEPIPSPHPDNRAGWAKRYLMKAGLLESPRRASIRITE